MFAASNSPEDPMSPLETVTAGWYNLFYSLAVAVAGWATFDAGRRRGWASTRWTLAVAAWIAGGVIGAMLPHLLFGDAVAYRTSIGAMIVATITLAVAARMLGRGTAEVLDTTAIAIPLGASIVRIGCFLAECCEGVATSLPVGIAQHDGDIARHPAQLYESSLEAGLALFLVRRGSWSRPGQRFASSMAGMCAIRFATEFVRDNEKFSGLSLAQWVILPIAALCVILLLSGARKRQPRRVLTSGARQTTIALVGALAIAAVAVGLPGLESTVLMIGAAVMVAATVRKMGRVAPTGLAVLALQMPPLAADSTYPRTYHFFGGGMNVGSWDALHRSSTCEDGVTEEWKRRHSAYGTSAELGTRKQNSATRGVGARIRGYYGTDAVGAANVSIGNPQNPGPYTQHSVGFTAVGDADWKWVGLSVGFSAGKFYPMDEGYQGNAYGADSRAKAITGFPAFGLRVGKLDGFSVETRVGDESPMWIPGPVTTIAIGIGDSRGNRLRIGAAETGLFVGGRRMMANGLEISPSIVAFGGSDDYGTVQNSMHAGVAFRKWFRASRPPQGDR
jgi:prolipoprotein diacylglyceryltransferase